MVSVVEGRHKSMVDSTAQRYRMAAVAQPSRLVTVVSQPSRRIRSAFRLLQKPVAIVRAEQCMWMGIRNGNWGLAWSRTTWFWAAEPAICRGQAWFIVHHGGCTVGLPHRDDCPGRPRRAHTVHIELYSPNNGKHIHALCPEKTKPENF